MDTCPRDIQNALVQIIPWDDARRLFQVNRHWSQIPYRSDIWRGQWQRQIRAPLEPLIKLVKSWKPGNLCPEYFLYGCWRSRLIKDVSLTMLYQDTPIFGLDKLHVPKTFQIFFWNKFQGLEDHPDKYYLLLLGQCLDSKLSILQWPNYQITDAQTSFVGLVTFDPESKDLLTLILDNYVGLIQERLHKQWQILIPRPKNHGYGRIAWTGLSLTILGLLSWKYWSR